MTGSTKASSSTTVQAVRGTSTRRTATKTLRSQVSEESTRRPKTDYTYSRSNTYRAEVEQPDLPVPNLSRRKIHGLSGAYGAEYGEIQRRTRSQQHYHGNGPFLGTSTPNHNANNNGIIANGYDSTIMSHRENYMMETTVTEEEFEEGAMPTRCTKSRSRVNRSPARSPSRLKSARKTASKRSSRLSEEPAMSIQYGLDSDISDTEFTSETSMASTTVSHTRSVRMSAIRSSSIVRHVQCALVTAWAHVTRCTLAVTSKLYRFLAMSVVADAGLLSWSGKQRARRGCAGAMCYLWPLLVLIPLFLSLLCGAHTWGYVSAPVCPYLGGIYYMTQDSLASSTLFSGRTREVLLDLGAKADQASSGLSSGQVETMVSALVDKRLAALRTGLEQEHNKQLALQLQKLGDLDAIIKDSRADISRLREKQELAELREKKLPSEEYLVAYIKHEIAKHKPPKKVNESLLALQAASIPEPAPPPPMPCKDSSVLCLSELEVILGSLRADLVALSRRQDEAAERAKEEKARGATSVYIASPNGTGISEEHVNALISKKLQMFDADKTGMPDFALESVGGQIVTTRCSDTYYGRSSMVTWFDIPLWHLANSPNTVIQPEVNPGQCWAFYGTRGSVVIKLAGRVKFTSFSLEHIPRSLSPTGSLESAPQDFEVYGLTDEYDMDPLLMRSGRYEASGEPIQFFPLQEGSTSAFSVVELRVVSNWGNPDYTCLYRFRVHGQLVSP